MTSRCLLFSLPPRSILPLFAALLLIPASGMAQPEEWPPPPTVHFAASGDYSWATARVSVDVHVLDGSELSVTLTSPSGSEETLNVQRESGSRRHTWTGRLEEPGSWRVAAVVDGPLQGRESGEASLSLMAGEPTCSVALSAPEVATHYLDAAIVVNSCDSAAETGSIATRHVRVLRDGVQVASVNTTDSCERTFILPGDGSYEAILEVADDRGVGATCSSNDLDVAVEYARYWPILDGLAGIYRSERGDIMNTPQSDPLAGAAIGITIPHDAAAASTTAFSARAGAGIGTNQWGGTAFDLIVTRQTPGGFFGMGAGLWGVGDSEITDAGIFGTAGFNLDSYYKAGQTQLFLELRGFARRITSFQNNYVAAVGVRVNFKDTHKLFAR